MCEHHALLSILSAIVHIARAVDNLCTCLTLDPESAATSSLSLLLLVLGPGSIEHLEEVGCPSPHPGVYVCLRRGYLVSRRCMTPYGSGGTP